MTSSPTPCLEATQGSSQRPIDRLPTEILLAIFNTCSDWDPEEDDPSHFLAWTSVLHVCRYWYWTGVSYPLLWRTVCSAASEECLRTVLRRSNDLSLSVYIILIPNLSDAKVIDVNLKGARLLLDQAHRTRHLSIEIKRYMIPEMKNLIRRVHGLPNLQHLKLCILPTHLGEDYDGKLDELLPFPLPALQRLDIMTSCNISTLPNAPNLQSLTLESVFIYEGRSMRDGTFELVPFLSALQNMPRLTKLDVCGMRPWLGPDIEIGDIAPIVLPNVRWLTLEGPVPECTWLCDRLMVPPTAGIALELYMGDEREVDIAVQAVTRLFARDAKTSRAPRSVAISNTRRGLVVEGTSATDDILRPTLFSDSRPNFWLHFKRRRYTSHPAVLSLDHLSTLLEALPLSNMRALNIVGYKARNSLVPKPLRKSLLEGKQRGIGCKGQFLRTDFSLDTRLESRWRQMFPNLQKIHWAPRRSCNAA